MRRKSLVQATRPASPLGAVIAALDRALVLNEVTAEQREWALSRLGGRGRPHANGGDGTDRREAVLKAATACFLQHGYHHATLDDVAAEVPLTKAGLYHYFSSKQEILDVICERAMGRFEAIVRQGLAGPGGVEDRLRTVAGRYLDAFFQEPSLSVFMRHFDDLSDPARKTLRGRRKRVESELRRALEEGMRAGAFAAGDPQVAVLAIFGAVNWAHSWYEPGGRLTPAEVRDALVAQLLTGVRPS